MAATPTELLAVSTTTRQPPAPAAPMAPSKRLGSTTTDDRRVVIRGVPWDVYERLSEAIGDQHVRLNYDGKDLEIMAPGLKHEDLKWWVTLILDAVMMACRIPGRLGGQTTWRRPCVERGLEADQCAWFDPDKVAAVKALRDSGVKDMGLYPVPELAIEIDVSTPEIDRPAIYSGLRIDEIWRTDGDVVVFERLGTDGRYVAVERSQFLPVRTSDVRVWLSAKDAGETEWRIRLAEWAAALATGGDGA
jgi:Uma2 family endonuclease